MQLLFTSLPRWFRAVLITAWLSCCALVCIALQGYGEGAYGWWVWAVTAGSVITSAWTAVSLLRLSKPVTDTINATVQGLSWAQRCQVATVWRPGPVPKDPAVLIAVLRHHDLMQIYRRRNRRLNRISFWFILIGQLFVVVSQYFTAGPRMAGFWLIGSAVLIWLMVLPAWQERRRAPRLAELRSAADGDPRIAMAVADAITPSAFNTARSVRTRIVFTLALISLMSVIIAATILNPHQRACRAAHHATREYWHVYYAHIYGDNFGPTSPAAVRTEADHLQQLGSTVSDPAISPHLVHAAALAARISASIESPDLPRGTSPKMVPEVAKLTMQMLDATQAITDACS
jgi:hypothetical protein